MLCSRLQIIKGTLGSAAILLLSAGRLVIISPSLLQCIAVSSLVVLLRVAITVFCSVHYSDLCFCWIANSRCARWVSARRPFYHWHVSIERKRLTSGLARCRLSQLTTTTQSAQRPPHLQYGFLTQTHGHPRYICDTVRSAT